VLTDDISDIWVRIEHRCQDSDDYGLELRSETFRPLQDLYVYKPEVIFRDNFTNKKDDDWTQFRGTWSAETKEYVTIEPAEDFYTFTGNASWSNYIFEADVKVAEWVDREDDVGLVFYSQPGYDQIIRFTIVKVDDNTVEPRISFMWYDDEEEEYTNEDEDELAIVINDELSLVDDTWYHLKVEIVGNTVYGYVDDVLFAITDGSELPLYSGGIGLVRDGEGQTSFDNVLVTTVTIY
jgi:hypothetical protein